MAELMSQMIVHSETIWFSSKNNVYRKNVLILKNVKDPWEFELNSSILYISILSPKSLTEIRSSSGL